MNDDCLKLTIYFGERDRSGGQFLADALFDIYGRHQVRTSILLRGIEGFGAKHHLRTDTLLTLSEDLPLVSLAVDAPERIEGLLGEVGALERHADPGHGAHAIVLTLRTSALASCTQA